jgi:NAD(P)-dependent dehydrogenase (short-subunit alcohol dehydrogenase family)
VSDPLTDQLKFGHIYSEDWLPADTPIERIAELRAEHQAALAEYEQAAAPAREASERFFMEDHAFEQRLREWGRRGEGERPTKTPEEERKRVLAPLREAHDAAKATLLGVAERIEREFREHLSEWTTRAHEVKAQAYEHAAELRRQADEAEARVRSIDGLVHWMGITARPGPFGHQPSGEYITTAMPTAGQQDEEPGMVEINEAGQEAGTYSVKAR